MEGYIQPGSLGVTSVNGHTGEVNLTAADVKARPDTWTPTAEEVKARPNTWIPTAAEVKARPDTWIPSDAELNISKIHLGRNTIKVTPNIGEKPSLSFYYDDTFIGSLMLNGSKVIGNNFSTPYIKNKDDNYTAEIYTSANPPYPRVPGAQEGHVALFDASGNIVSSGRSFWNFHRATFTLSGTTLYINTVA